MATNSYQGYNPFFPTNPGGGAYYLVNSDANNCYGYQTGIKKAVFPDGTQYKEDCDALRQYVIELESTRSIKDLADVSFTRNVTK